MKAGHRLGAYELLDAIGEGGMGRVYRARDPRLRREVAIKVLPAEMASGAKRRLRFEREARALAALNHPNIATIHEAGYDEATRETFLVMELISGEDLSSRLSRGRMTIADTLAVADQLAGALAAAHEAGIVHRDLKPGNIKVRQDGTVKVLDFGLAWRDEEGDPAGGAGDLTGDSQAEPPNHATTQTVTLAAGRTADGAVIGTAAYMAPEQARGESIDKRTDIWAFGVVLFEMLTGQRPFLATNAADTLQALLTRDPDWAALPADTPPAIRRLLARCLTRDRRRRLHDIADARLEIADALSPPDAESIAPRATNRTRTWAAAAIAAAAGLGAGAVLWRSELPAVPVVHARLNTAPADALDSGGKHLTMVLPAGGTRTALEWSPDGKTLGFIGLQAGTRRVFLRDLGSSEARPVAGTDRAGLFAFSPDGGSIAFWADNSIKRVPTAGGPVVDLLKEVPDLHALAWGPARIVGTDGRLWWIPPVGAKTRETLMPDDGAGLVRHSTPFLLPDESAVIYTEYSRQWTAGGERVMVLPLAPGATPKELVAQASDARYLRSGHLSFLRNGTLYLAPFDARALELRGEPVALVTNISHAVQAWDSWDLTMAGQYAISQDGSLAYVSAPLPAYPDHELVAADRSGRIKRLPGPARGYRNRIAAAPSGDRLGVTTQTASGFQLFALNLANGTVSRVADTLAGEPMLVDWSANDELAVATMDHGRITSALTRPDAGPPIRPIAGSDGFWPASLSSTGKLAAMGDSDIWIFTADGSTPPAPLARTQAMETQPAWSPDGRWIAFTSNSGGRSEVVLRQYPDTGATVTVSINGGSSPSWHPSGRELFYVESDSADDRLMSVAFSPAGRASAPRGLFTTAKEQFFRSGSVFTPYVVARDGERFIAVRLLPRASAPVTELHVVFNWIADARARLGR